MNDHSNHDDMYKVRTAHFMFHWGVPKHVHMRADLDGKKLGILEFAPGRGLPAWALVSNGMSEHVQEGAGKPWRTEVFALFKDIKPWTIRFLDGIARYPVTNQCFLADYHTITMPEHVPPDVPPSLGGVLFVPPTCDATGTLSGIRGEEEKEVIVVLQAVAYLPSERSIAEAEEGKLLFEKMRREKRSWVLGEEG